MRTGTSGGITAKEPSARRGPLIIIAFLLLILVIPLPASNGQRVSQAWWDFAHVPAFALFAILAGKVMPGGRARWAWPAVMVLVPLIELIQSATGREASWADVLYGWSGATIGGLIAATGKKTIPRRPGIVFAGLLLAATLFHPVWTALDTRQQGRMFPDLARFSSRSERFRWSTASCQVQWGDGALVSIQAGIPFPRMFLRDFPSDWSAYHHLCIDAELDSERALTLWVRIDDLPGEPRYGDRFQRELVVQPGRQVLCLPRAAFGHTSGGRPMHMQAITRFGLFFEEKDAGRRVLLHRIYLEH